MTLTLTIENVAALPDGGPLSVSLAGQGGIDIGRDQYLDWSLPDPDRVISGKHAEVRFRDGGYWLKDVSRNGTFLNRNPQRLQEGCRLRDGDRIEIGRYVIAVRIDEAASADASRAPVRTETSEEFWGSYDDAAPPASIRDFKSNSASSPVKPDFAEWAVDLPASRSGSADAMEWSPSPFEEQSRLPKPKPVRPRPDKAAPVSWGPAPPATEPMERGERPRAGRDDPWMSTGAGIHETHSSGLAASPEERPALRALPAGNDEFVERLAAGLGIAPELLSWRDPGDLAEDVGLLLRLCTENLKQLLAARAESKRTTRTPNQTTIQAFDNNPLKFAPTVDDALRIMFGRPSSGYLPVRPAMETGFSDLKTHQIKTYAAMQSALRLLVDNLSPEGIEASDEKDRGLTGLLGSRKARLWDIYATRWNALASSHDDGMVDAFMALFSDCYDKKR